MNPLQVPFIDISLFFSAQTRTSPIWGIEGMSRHVSLFLEQLRPPVSARWHNIRRAKCGHIRSKCLLRVAARCTTWSTQPPPTWCRDGINLNYLRSSSEAVQVWAMQLEVAYGTNLARTLRFVSSSLSGFSSGFFFSFFFFCMHEGTHPRILPAISSIIKVFVV